MMGTVYFIEEGPGGPIKIGFTSRLALTRLKELQTGNSRELKLLVDVSGSEDDEDSLHKRFAFAKIRGELFRRTPSLLELIEALQDGISLRSLLAQ